MTQKIYELKWIWLNNYSTQMIIKKRLRLDRKKLNSLHKAMYAADLASETNGGINIYVLEINGGYRLFDSIGYGKWIKKHPGFEKKFPIVDAVYTAHKKPKMSIGKNGSLIHT